jgi:hypothetical protein
MCNEDSSPISILKMVASAHTGKETDTFQISGHFLFYLQQKTEQREDSIFKFIRCPQKHTIQIVVIPKSEILAGSDGLWPERLQANRSVLCFLPL